MSEKLKNGLIIAYIPIFLVCLVLNVWLLFYEMVLKNSVAIQTGYVDSMAYSGEDEKFFIEAEYFPNEYGVKLNYYTDTEVPEKNEDGSYGKKYTYSTGVQFGEGGISYFKSTSYGFWKSYSKIVLKNCTYYNSEDNGTTYTAITDFSDRNSWVYDIKGKLVLLEEKEYELRSKTLGWGVYYRYDTARLILDLSKSVKSFEDGVHVVTFDLSKYYTFTFFNEETKRFDEKITDKNVLKQYVYINIKVTKSSNDFVSANQSMFGMYKGDRNWTLYDFEKADYWRARNEYNFTIKDFTFVYENNAYYLKLQNTIAEFFGVFKNMKYIVTIDLDNIYLGSEKINVSGFSEKAFGTLGIDEINLISNETRTFKVYNNYSINCPENITISFVGGVT